MQEVEVVGESIVVSVALTGFERVLGGGEGLRFWVCGA